MSSFRLMCLSPVLVFTSKSFIPLHGGFVSELKFRCIQMMVLVCRIDLTGLPSMSAFHGFDSVGIVFVVGCASYSLRDDSIVLH